MSDVCLVHGCTNHRNEGAFVGDLCKPCHTMLTTGRLNPASQTFIDKIKAELAAVVKALHALETDYGLLQAEIAALRRALEHIGFHESEINGIVARHTAKEEKT